MVWLNFYHYPQVSPHQTWKKTFFFTLKVLECTFGGKKRINNNKFDIATNCVNQKLNINAFFFFLLTGSIWYNHTIYLVFTYFASLLDEIFEVFSNLLIRGSKFGVKINKFYGNSFKKLNFTEFMEFIFFQVCSSLVNCVDYFCSLIEISS